MFIDKSYECVTIKTIRDEIFQTAKFRNKYPWLNNLRTKIKPLPSSTFKNPNFDLKYKVITALNDTGIINERTKRRFDLSYEDRKIIAFALTYGYMISSGDGDLIDLPQQQFSEIFKGSISPLEIINRWVENDMISWDDVKQEYIFEWNSNNEHRQPQEAIIKFKKLTGRKYPGP